MFRTFKFFARITKLTFVSKCQQLTKPGPSTSAEGEAKQGETTGEEVPDDIYAYYDKMDKEEDEEEDTKTVSFEVKQEKIEVIQKRSGVIVHFLKHFISLSISKFFDTANHHFIYHNLLKLAKIIRYFEI